MTETAGVHRAHVRAEADLVTVRRLLRRLSTDAGLGVVRLTKLVTAGSELARNILLYAGHGSVEAMLVDGGVRRGVQARFEDRGPGIPDVELAFQDGWTSGTGLGKGLPGARRLVDELRLETGEDGTTVVVTQWAQ